MSRAFVQGSNLRIEDWSAFLYNQVVVPLEIALLGTPTILLDGQPVAFESRKALALLAFLAVAGEPRQRGELATLLWPESDNKRARGALRYTLSVLQGALGKEWFQTDRESIGLHPSDGRFVDVEHFQSLLAIGQEHTHPPDTACLDCIEQISEAVVLYRDDFLTGFSLRDSINFDEWHFFQRESLRHQLSGGLRCLIRYLTQQGDYELALNHIRRLLQMDPLQESVQREAMQLYAYNGQWELALHQYETCVQLLEAELGVPPSPATTQLYAQIRERKLGESDTTAYSAPQPTTTQPTTTQQTALPHSADSGAAADSASPPAGSPVRPTNVTTAAAPMLGRKREIDALLGLLHDDHCRMVTLLGPGGIGKTRLAHQLAHDLCHEEGPHFANGVYFVPLAAVETTELLVAAIANALDVSFSGPKSPKEQLLQYLAEQQLLIVLDNFEQLVASAPLLADLLNAASRIKLLITSRERPNLYEEWLYEIQGLPLPPPQAEAAQKSASDDVDEQDPTKNEAVQLFYQRARRLDPRFDLSNALPSVVQICRLLQGMPLGIELAAGWVRTFSVEEIARQVQADLDFLATPLQNVPDRHRSLRAAFLHSWRGMTADEQALFAKAAIFRGGFGLDAARAVTGATPLTLSGLVDKSMIQRVTGTSDQPERYTIHELLRQYAEEELSAADREDTCRQHCAYFAAFVDARSCHRSLATEQPALDEIQAEIENVRAAWGWLVEQIRTGGTEDEAPYILTQLGRFIPMLAHYFQRYSLYAEGQQFFRSAATAMGSVKQLDNVKGHESGYRFRLAQIEARLAELAFNLSRFQEVVDTYQRLLPLFRQAEDGNEIGGALVGLGKSLIRMGRYAEAEPLLQEGLSTFRITEDVTGVTNALNALGILYSNRGHFEQARPHYEEFLAIARKNEHARGTANALNNLGSNYARAGLHKQAEPLYKECYHLALESGEGLMIAASLSNLGSVSRVLGRLTESRRYYAESLAICRDIGERRWTAAGLNGLGLTLIDSGNHTEARTHLLEALAIAQSIDSTPDMLDALAPLGEVALMEGDDKRGVKILRFVAEHPVTQTLARERSSDLLEKLAQVDGGTNEEANKKSLEMAGIIRLAKESGGSDR